MKRSSYGLPTRIHAGRWLYLLALAGLPVVGVAQVQTTYPTAWNPAYGGWAYEYSGTGATARPGTVVFTGNSSVPSNTPSTFTVPRGATENAGGRVYLNSTNDFDVPGSGGKKVPTNIKAPVNAASMGKALARFGAKSLPIVGTALALRDLLNELDICHYIKSGDIVQYCEKADLQVNGYGVSGFPEAFGATPDAACRSAYAIKFPNTPRPQYYGVVGSICYPSESAGSGLYAKTGVIKGGQQIDIYEENVADKIAGKSGWPTTSTIAQAVAEAMRNPQVMNDPATAIKLDSPTITGPASVPTGSTTTTNPDGSTVTRTTTTNITYNGPNITTSTTTVTNNTTNNTTTTTTTTSTGTGDAEDPCKGNPDRAGCAKLDVPEGEIPKKNFVVTYVAENLFGTGSCPADKFANIGGHSVKVWDWQQSCAYLLNYVKPLIIALATFAAYFMLSPGKTE